MFEPGPPTETACLVYLSQATIHLSDDQLDSLEVQSASANELLRITGYLFYANDKFVQYIEGPAATLDELYKRICNDSRHTILNTIRGTIGSERRFPRWSMRQINRRSMFGLEELLAQHMNWVTSSPASPNISDELAWSMVDRIAEMQARL